MDLTQEIRTATSRDSTPESSAMRALDRVPKAAVRPAVGGASGVESRSSGPTARIGRRQSAGLDTSPGARDASLLFGSPARW